VIVMTTLHNKLRSTLVALLIGAVGMIIGVGCTGEIRTRGYVAYEAPAPPPPPRQYVVGVAPYQGAVWVDGQWQWNGYDWQWVDGYWQEPRVGHVWIQPRWERRGGSWVYARGAWQPRGSVRVAPGQYRGRGNVYVAPHRGARGRGGVYVAPRGRGSVEVR
jgi:hypothetical protein